MGQYTVVDSKAIPWKSPNDSIYPKPAEFRERRCPTVGGEDQKNDHT